MSALVAVAGLGGGGSCRRSGGRAGRFDVTGGRVGEFLVETLELIVERHAGRCRARSWSEDVGVGRRRVSLAPACVGGLASSGPFAQDQVAILTSRLLISSWKTSKGVSGWSAYCKEYEIECDTSFVQK